MKIRKQIKLLVLLIFIILLIPFIRKIFIKEYNIIYEKNNFIINEIYKYENKEHKFEINIKNKEYEITYLLNEDFNKNNEIIKDIKLYQEKDINCILPIYTKNIENKLYCVKDNKQVSNYYLNKNKDYNNILKQVKKYKIKKLESNNKTTKYKNLKIYKNNLKEEDIFTIWDYKGINIIEKNNNKYVKILDYDLYDEIKTIIYDKYFVLFENSHVDGIENIYYYDFKKDKLKLYNPEIIISKDFYINGVVNNLIYVTDNKAKKEYTINLIKKEIEQISKANEYITYKDNKFISLTKSDYFMEKQIFSNNKTKNKSISKEDHIKENNIYYYIEDNKFIRKIEDRNSEILFELENIKDWKIINGKILLISEDILYIYDDNRGLVPIVQSNELNYNYENICDYKEKN